MANSLFQRNSGKKGTGKGDQTTQQCFGTNCQSDRSKCPSASDDWTTGSHARNDRRRIRFKVNTDFHFERFSKIRSRPGLGMPGPFRGPIRGDPIVPGNLIDPDQGRRDPDRPDFPQDIPRGGFNPDGSFDDGTFGLPRRGPGRPGRGNRPFHDPFGGSGFI